MRTIGILGGMSRQATVEYYRLLDEGVNKRLGGRNAAEIVINSVNFAHIERFARTEAWDDAGRYLLDKAQSVERAGAKLLICASNTMHSAADTFTAGLSIPFLHIADPTGAAIQAAGLKRVGLLGTKPVMALDFMKDRYREKFGIETLVPTEEEQVEIDRIIFDELVYGELKPQSKAYYLEVMNRLRRRGAEGIIFGCTEIILLVDQSDQPDLPMFDTTSLHVEAAVRFALDDDAG